MPITHLTPEEYVKFAPESSLWQSLEWKKYQESLGRETRLYGIGGSNGALAAVALCVIDRTVFGLCTWDIPRGPLWSENEAAEGLLEGILEEAKKERCMAVYLSPAEQLQACPESCRRVESYKLKVDGSPSTFNLQPSTRSEQPEATLILDLRVSDDVLLAQMKQKGRYNIGIAKREGVIVEESQDIESFYTLITKTGKRDRFGTHPKEHYEKFLMDLPGSFLLLASKDNAVIAGLLGVIWGNTGIYYFGASDYEQRALMAPYLLQWHAMQLCKKKGCTEYDLLGIAPERSEDHAWSGITQFKKQFGGSVKTYAPEQEIVLKPLMKKMIGWKRAIAG